MGEPKKPRFYELDRESKMRLLKTHSRISKRPCYEARKTRRKKVEGNADPPRCATDQNPAAYRRCDGGRAKRKRHHGKTNHQRRRYGKENHRRKPPAYRQCGGGGETKRGEVKGNTGAKTRGSHAKNFPQPHRRGGGGMRKQQIPSTEGDTTYSPARGRSV